MKVQETIEITNIRATGSIYVTRILFPFQDRNADMINVLGTWPRHLTTAQLR